MAWDQATGDALGRGARFIRGLESLEVGERYRLNVHDLLDMLFPIGGLLDRPTPEEKAAFIAERVPFPCRTWEDLMSGDWIFERLPKDRWAEATRRRTKRNAE